MTVIEIHLNKLQVFQYVYNKFQPIRKLEENASDRRYMVFGDDVLPLKLQHITTVWKTILKFSFCIFKPVIRPYCIMHIQNGYFWVFLIPDLGQSRWQNSQNGHLYKSYNILNEKFIPGGLLILDFEKAFCRLDWRFI